MNRPCQFGVPFHHGWVLALLVLVLCPMELPAEEPAAEVRLSIRTYNFAGVPEGVLAKSRAKTIDLLDRAGITAELLECPLTPEELSSYPACAALTGPAVIALKILPEHMARVYTEDRHSLGFALLGPVDGLASDAWVFYDRVTTQARDGRCYIPALLSHAIAHEIGHLLLGAESHSDDSIMQDFWGPRELKLAERGGLVFTAEQMRRMREHLKRRIAGAIPTSD